MLEHGQLTPRRARLMVSRTGIDALQSTCNVQYTVDDCFVSGFILLKV